MQTKEMYEARSRVHQAKGNLAYLLEVFGDEIAEREGYKDLDGMDAVHLYLIRTHHWLPRDVLSMSAEDLRLALHVEMQGWTVPGAARHAGS